MGDPPLSAGADQDTVKRRSPATTAWFNGIDGANIGVPDTTVDAP